MIVSSCTALQSTATSSEPSTAACGQAGDREGWGGRWHALARVLLCVHGVRACMAPRLNPHRSPKVYISQKSRPQGVTALSLLVSRLSLSDPKLASLSGIELCHGLETCRLDETSVNTLDPLPVGNLRTLSLRGAQHLQLPQPTPF